jgi:hypothetical protein
VADTQAGKLTDTTVVAQVQVEHTEVGTQVDKRKDNLVVTKRVGLDTVGSVDSAPCKLKNGVF